MPEIFPACSYQNGHKMCIGIYKGTDCGCKCHKTIHCDFCNASSEVIRTNALPVGWAQCGENERGTIATYCPKCVPAPAITDEEKTKL